MRYVDEIDEADLIDQLVPVDPSELDLEPDGALEGLVDEADWLDQQVDASVDDPGADG
ncbi:MAG TPA: hypothetical protein PKA93_03805 [Arachnia sp.]|nr:hypothetical protein [Arachnia sp.]